jgi:hypothetical protein
MNFRFFIVSWWISMGEFDANLGLVSARDDDKREALEAMERRGVSVASPVACPEKTNCPSSRAAAP